MSSKICCESCYGKQFRLRHPEKMKQSRENQKQKLNNDPEKLKERKEKNKKWRIENAEKLREYQNQYKLKYPEKISETLQKSRIKHSDKIKQREREYRINNADAVHQKCKKWRDKNLDKLNKYKVDRRKNNPLFKLRNTIRNRINAFIHHKNGKKSLDMIGCTVEYLKEWIEGQFEKGMNWDNHSKDGWHIDHILPLCAAENEEDFLVLTHYTNLRPLWAEDNHIKGGKERWSLMN